jgi:hypothetical protein
MSSKSEDIEERFRQLEREAMAEPVKRAEPARSSEPTAPPNTASDAIGIMSSLFGWIDRQTGATKIVAIASVGIIGFAILNFLFKIVAAGISLAIFAAVMYVLYKVFLEKSPSDPKS